MPWSESPQVRGVPVAWRAVIQQAVRRAGEPRDGTWWPYDGIARWALATALLVLAAALVWASTRLRTPLRTAVPGRLPTVVMLVTWTLSIVMFLVGGLGVYVAQKQQVHLAYPSPPNPIMPVTLTAALVTFLVIRFTAARDQPRRLVGAVVGAMAGPMVFELPFDLIIVWRIYPPLPPHPGLYRALYFLPLFLIEITTLWLVTLSPRAAIRPATLRCLATMLATFALWAVTGFGFPGSPVPYWLNVVSKLLAFATALSLFLPGSAPSEPPEGVLADHSATAPPLDSRVT